MRRPRIGPRGRWAGCLAVAAIAGCAATGVTLRSNHYRVYVPADWQVIDTGGVTDVPTVLRVPAPADRATSAMEIRLYPWLAQGPLADPTGDALKHLADGGVLGSCHRDRRRRRALPGAEPRVLHIRQVHARDPRQDDDRPARRDRGGTRGRFTGERRRDRRPGPVGLRQHRRHRFRDQAAHRRDDRQRRFHPSARATEDRRPPRARRADRSFHRPIPPHRRPDVRAYSQPRARAPRTTAAPQTPAATSSSITPQPPGSFSAARAGQGLI